MHQAVFWVITRPVGGHRTKSGPGSGHKGDGKPQNHIVAIMYLNQCWLVNPKMEFGFTFYCVAQCISKIDNLS